MSSGITDNHVTARFNSAAATYHDQPGVQYEVAGKVADMCTDPQFLPSGEVSDILEIGCGTGYLTRLLAEHFEDAEIVATDVSRSMIDTVRKYLQRHTNVVLHPVDVRSMSLSPARDLIVSSSALHWINPLPPVLQRLMDALRPGGVLVCALMTRGTLCELHDLRKQIAPDKQTETELPDAQELIASLNKDGYEMDYAVEQSITVQYPTALDFMKTLNRQGVTGGFFNSANRLNRTELKKLVTAYDQLYPHPDGGVRATYNVFYLVYKAGQV